jgi:LacI family transcriptional regulator
MATIHDVARRARVSASTVSHVMNGTRFVSEATRARVEDAIEALGFRPNALARSLRQGQSHTLGLILPDSANPYFAEIGRELETSAFEAGYSVVLCNTENEPEKERLYVNVLIRNQVDGILLVATGDLGDSVEALVEDGFPLVTLDREASRPGCDSVIADHFHGGQLATRHLLSLGHRRIACIAGPAGLSSSAQRLAGYRKAMQEAGERADDGLVRHGDFHPESGWAATRQLLRGARPPSAIFASNDLMAMGALRAAHELGRSVPEDLAVVGYDDIELSRYTIPPLSTVAQPKREMAREALRLMTRRIEAGQLPARKRPLAVSLVVRRTCGGAPATRPEPEGR